MEKIRFGIIGTGWRAEFFMRIAKALPEQFTLTNVMCRSAEKGNALAARMGVVVVNSFEEVIAEQPDFVVVSVARTATYDYLEKLAECGMPVLCETPPAHDKETLYKIWDMAQKTGAKIQIAEQYHYQPLYASLLKLIANGTLGEVSNMKLSALHGYHAVAVFRRIFGAGMCDVTVSGKRFEFPVVETDSRYGIVKTGEMGSAVRDVLTFEFANGKVAFFDFSGKQYHSAIRTRYLNIQGTHGEVDNFDVRYVNAVGDAVCSPLSRVDRGIYDNPELSHQHISFNGEVLFENPFLYQHFNDDEIAMASMLIDMARYVKTGVDMYSLADGLHDALIAHAMDEAATTGVLVTVGKQPWTK